MTNAPLPPATPPRFEVQGPDISGVVIDDGEPLDNIYSEKQQRLLTEPLYTSWPGPPGPTEGGEAGHRPFLATANVGVFATAHDAPLVPDVLVSIDVAAHPDLPHEKRHQTYFIWEFGKPPDVVVEIVSNRKGGELGKRKAGYERMAIFHFVVWDPERLLRERELMAYVLTAEGYIPMTQVSFARLGGLSLRPWEGSYEGLEARWLRWFDGDQLIPTGAERAAAEAARADAAEARAEAESQRAEAESRRAAAAAERAERLAALLVEHGIASGDL